jgi:hypothetical protein
MGTAGKSLRIQNIGESSEILAGKNRSLHGYCLDIEHTVRSESEARRSPPVDQIRPIDDPQNQGQQP